MPLFGLFGKKKRTLRDLSLDELSRERIVLQQEQRKLDVEIERLLKDDAQLKSEYAEAVNPTQKRIIARKIQDVRMRQQGVEAKSTHCHKMLQTVNNFTLIKENMVFFERMGVASVLTTMDMAEIESFINEAVVEGTLQQEKLATMLQQVTEGAQQITAAGSDVSLDELMADLDREVAAEAVPAAPTRDAELDQVMSELDAAITRGAQLARQAQQGQKQKAAES
jgi:hypothetical protein